MFFTMIEQINQKFNTNQNLYCYIENLMIAFVFVTLFALEANAYSYEYQPTQYGQFRFTQPTHFVASYGHYYKEIPIDYSKPNGYAKALDEANRVYENQRDASWQW